MVKLKGADRKQEYGEKNINKLNHRLDPEQLGYIKEFMKCRLLNLLIMECCIYLVFLII